jgi:hypothetical protein
VRWLATPEGGPLPRPMRRSMLALIDKGSKEEGAHPAFSGSFVGRRRGRYGGVTGVWRPGRTATAEGSADGDTTGDTDPIQQHLRAYPTASNLMKM